MLHSYVRLTDGDYILTIGVSGQGRLTLCGKEYEIIDELFSLGLNEADVAALIAPTESVYVVINCIANA